jgi:1,4-dihydroxy-2-naphthoate octaprenyltransferase
MLQIIAFGIGFLLAGVGVIAHDVHIIATPIEKRTASTGSGERIVFILLGILIIALAAGLGVSF